MNGLLVFRRLLLALPTLLGVILVVFVLLRVVPGDPIAMMITSDSTPADILHLRHLYGLDQPIYVQFAIYLGQLARGDFGTSISLGQDVLPLILSRLPATLELAVAALILGSVLGLALALVSTYWQGGWIESAVDGFNAFSLAIPEFLWGLIFILVFAVALPLLPISGRRDPSTGIALTSQFYLFESLFRGDFRLFSDVLQHLLLPATALALPMISMVARILKSSLQSELAQDYILFGRIKGFSRFSVLIRHALPNAMIPTVTAMGVHFIFLIGGTVLVELIFAYPGIGNMLYGAAINRDLPLIQGITIAFAVLFIVLNVLIDLTYTLIDPRVRQR
jgi:ABC-type dipeptide/oligopeptide/nickel transport system permease component